MSREFSHQPVLLNEILEAFDYLGNRSNAVFVDGTLGLAGHSLAVAKQISMINNQFSIIGIDKDEEALKIAKDNIARAGMDKYFRLVHDDFHNLTQVLAGMRIEKVDGILLDLGVSSMQLDDARRGFSFSDPNAPLDMRMDQSQQRDAVFVINNYSPKELERVLRHGEEKYWRRVARVVCETRKERRINTVGELISVLAKALPKDKSKKHFATDTFRALRMEVNDELSPLATTIGEMVNSFTAGGRLAIISFHSLEDRIVKQEFRRLENPCTCPPKLPYCICGLKPSVKVITKKPIIPSDLEIEANPRARSAKLRVVEKI